MPPPRTQGRQRPGVAGVSLLSHGAPTASSGGGVAGEVPATQTNPRPLQPSAPRVKTLSAPHGIRRPAQGRRKADALAPKASGMPLPSARAAWACPQLRPRQAPAWLSGLEVEDSAGGKEEDRQLWVPTGGGDTAQRGWAAPASLPGSWPTCWCCHPPDTWLHIPLWMGGRQAGYTADLRAPRTQAPDPNEGARSVLPRGQLKLTALKHTRGGGTRCR